MKKYFVVIFLMLQYINAVYAQTSTQMPLPPHAAVFSGNVRGYWFTSPTCFTITGLEVPTDASTGLQNIAVVRFNSGPPPVYSSTTNDFTVLFLTQNDTGTGIIPVSIQVGVGDVIGVLGCRDDNNSYAPVPAASTINGLPVALERLGMQFALSTTGPQDLWTETSGNLSRVWIYYDANFTFSLTSTWLGGTSYSFSNGSGPSSISVWDYGDGTPLDTAFNPSHTYATPGNYNVCSYITGACNSDTVCTTVIICPAPALADYTYASTYPDVTFNDNSLNAQSYYWDFGDGDTSNLQNPMHTYAASGLYNVCLSVTDSCGGVNTKCRPISVCPALIPVNLGSDITACGSALINLPGFTTYSWSTGSTTSQATVTSSGSYTVVATNSAGCSGIDTIIVTINPLPTLSLGNSVTQCGGSVTLTPISNAVSFQWSNFSTTQTITVSNSGNYSVTATDAIGCTNQASVSVTILTPPTANLGNDLNICQGFVSITASGGSSYLWNTGATTANLLVNSGGVYWVSVTAANGCTAADTINIVMNAPLVTYNESAGLVCINSAPITLSPGNPAGGYYTGQGVSGNQFFPSIAGLGSKSIVYNYVDTAGCTGRDTSFIVVDPCSGVQENQWSGIQVYPNPSSGIVHFQLDRNAELLVVTDILGREIVRTVPGENFSFDFSSLPEGRYTAIVTGEKMHAIKPFVIKR